MNFIELRVPKPIINALDDLGFVYPTPIQQKCYRRITSGVDVVGIAQTGTGKTFAYLLPILSNLEFSKQKHPRILIIVPTRELVMQVHEEAEKLCKYKNVRIKSVFGGANINTQKQYIYDGGCDIIIGTPGRLFDIAVTGVLRFANIKKIVIDEVDEMLSLGFRPQLEQIFEMLPEKRQHMMFSATLSEDVENFISRYFYQPEQIIVENKNTPVEKIEQNAVNIPNFHSKLNFLKSILNDEDISKVLVFANNKKDADLLFEKLSENYSDQLSVIHSNKSQNFRFNSIKNFEKGKSRILIATDVVARGLDFTDISHVINMSPPENPSDYIHRIGRTGRADKNGVSILLYSPFEEDLYLSVKDIAGENLIETDLPEGVETSKLLTEDEKPGFKQKNYIKAPDISKSGGAFHEKSVKNRKENSGGMRQKAKRKRKK
ncbi:MAG: DEAD/DEAH box helicase [Marinilabiliales bacterium]|nr:MAG: DEAD/DEAH box helicase [Marinilabiliales bacterium]